MDAERSGGWFVSLSVERYALGRPRRTGGWMSWTGFSGDAGWHDQENAASDRRCNGMARVSSPPNVRVQPYPRTLLNALELDGMRKTRCACQGSSLPQYTAYLSVHFASRSRRSILSSLIALFRNHQRFFLRIPPYLQRVGFSLAFGVAIWTFSSRDTRNVTCISLCPLRVVFRI